MAEQEIVAALNDALQNPVHTHTRIVRRPWWKWTIHWDSEEHRFWIKKHHGIEVPCSTPLEINSLVKVERERIGLQTRYTASRMFHCPEPSVPGNHALLLYAVAIDG